MSWGGPRIGLPTVVGDDGIVVLTMAATAITATITVVSARGAFALSGCDFDSIAVDSKNGVRPRGTRPSCTAPPDGRSCKACCQVHLRGVAENLCLRSPARGTRRGVDQ